MLIVLVLGFLTILIPVLSSSLPFRQDTELADQENHRENHATSNSAVNGFACTRPGASTGYAAPTADMSGMGDSTTAWPVAAGANNFAAVCAEGYGGTVSAAVCPSADAAYVLSGCTACVAGKAGTGGACSPCASGKWSDTAAAVSAAGCTSCVAGKKGCWWCYNKKLA